MGGWKTWASITGLVILAGVDITNGDYESAATKLSAAWGLYGIGHKVEKGAKK